MLVELLNEIPELRYVDLDTGQILEEQPPLAYPAALIEIDMSSCEDIQDNIQQVIGYFSVRLVAKGLSETNGLAPEGVRRKSLEWLRLQEKVYKKLQGYGTDSFYPFSRKSGKNENLRKGLKVFALRFDTSWHDYTANS
ncbi:hypothetical protein [Flavobacterium sp. HSC-61S13]|uniref:hypothetical protein n=1 Tax=Flavobacterium sp. HSC-61S13 TaxID=2910963 RepID=UPI00209E60AB|nr:hypothetical protein [Flavobacterium sp. HSC-61S13]MCP1997286.1 hypothetical protein [Flavobacterium sp. HSC-61S13]